MGAGPHLFDHVEEVLLLRRLHLVVGGHRLQLELVFGFGLGRLKGASQHAKLRVLDVFNHLRVRHVFVDHDAFDQFGVLQAATNLRGGTWQVRNEMAGSSRGALPS